MQEIIGNIWDYPGRAVVAITTNGQVPRNGRAALGKGCTREAGARFPWLAERLGILLRDHGNHVHYLGEGLVSFPVEHSPFENPDLRLIEQSARELAELADRHEWPMIVVPRPGCGGGGLDWREVRPILARYLDDRFHIITLPPS
ncbi:MAG: ADP-ribose-binding protein [Geobacter sp.]|nr:ADP-ribose-binding protein [Geobacter sp.]